MKKTNIIAMSLVGLAALPVIAADDSKPTAGELLQGINMFTPEEGDPAYKITANEKYGTQWYVDAAYGYWQTNKAMPGTNLHNNFFLVHAALNQRLIENSVTGGTWLRAEFSGSWGSIAAPPRLIPCSAMVSAMYPMCIRISTARPMPCCPRWHSCTTSTVVNPALSVVW